MENRQQKILELLQDYNYLTIKEIGEYCKVSLNTIRSDIQKLEAQGLVIKLHGNVLLNHSPSTPMEMCIRHNHKLPEKSIIGQLTMEQLPKDKEISIFFDSSTTSLEVAKHIVNHPVRITVVTNFVNIAQIISKQSHHSVNFCGGSWLNYENCTIGNQTTQQISSYFVDYAILGCTALDLEHGIFNGSFETVPVKQQMKNCARQTWIVCDHNKFDKTDLVSMFPIYEISAIITDKKPPVHWIEYARKHNIRLIYL
ncbi:MAG: DeoR/GlpR family DNA-binding transcription regulator [Brevinema sp.]